MLKARIVAIFLFSLLLGACSSTLNTRITTFTDASAANNKGSVAILPYDEEKAGSLEFSWYAEPLANKLEGLGFRVVEDPAVADYIVDLAFGVNRREANNRDDDTLIITSGFGSWRRGGSIGFVIDGDNDRRYEYERVVQLRLRKNSAQPDAKSEKGDSLVEISAVSTGRCELIQPIYPAMLDAIFRDFYRANGSTVRVKDSLPVDHCKTH